MFKTIETCIHAVENVWKHIISVFCSNLPHLRLKNSNLDVDILLSSVDSSILDYLFFFHDIFLPYLLKKALF